MWWLKCRVEPAMPFRIKTVNQWLKFSLIFFLSKLPIQIDRSLRGSVVMSGRRFYPGLLQSLGRDHKPRSRFHMTLAVGGSLNPEINQPTNQQIIDMSILLSRRTTPSLKKVHGYFMLTKSLKRWTAFNMKDKLNSSQMYSKRLISTKQSTLDNEKAQSELLAPWRDGIQSRVKDWTDSYRTVRVWTGTLPTRGSCLLPPRMQRGYRDSTRIRVRNATSVYCRTPWTWRRDGSCLWRHHR